MTPLSNLQEPAEAPALGFVEVRGRRFGYLSSGDSGPLALLLHGFPDTPHGFGHVIPALASAGYRVVAPFTRGYAPTEASGSSATTLDDLAEDALALIEAFGGQCAALIGHDWGAGTAYLAASLAPEVISKMVVIGVPHPAALRVSLKLLWVGRHFITLRLPFARQRMQRGNFRMVDEFYRRWSPTWRYDPQETEPVKACFRDPESLDAAIGYYRGARLGQVSEALRRKISVPTLAIAGEDDPAVTVSVYRAASRKFTGDYRVEAMPGGHFVHRESPDTFVRTLLAFLGPAGAVSR